jgi:hypothetical protein
MRWYRILRPAGALLGLTLATCKTDTGPSATARAVARFLNGATTAGVGMVQQPSRSTSPVGQLAVPTNGDWALSPDKVTLTLTHIRLFKGDGGFEMNDVAVNCPVTYDRARPGLTQIGDCPFQVPTGTYNSIDLHFSQTMQVLINDAVNGFYSTSSGIVTAPPAAGASVLPVSLLQTSPEFAGEFGYAVQLPRPLQILDTTLVNTVSVVIDGLQFFKANVQGGAVSLGWPGTGYTDPTKPGIVAAVGSVAGVEFYASAALGTAGSFCLAQSTNPVNACSLIPARVLSVSVYYASSTTPLIVSPTPGNGNSACQPFAAVGSFLIDPRSYLGLDANGNLGWANALDTTYTAYSAELRMARVTTLNGTTTLYCQNISGNPAPPGGSFASGAPNIASPANSMGTYILLAH